MNFVYSYSIFDIGQCNLKDSANSMLSIPKLQRGRVWNAYQIELLWDSLLRNFPIGTLIVLSDDIHADPPRGELLDGQQRVSAIISAFQEPRKNSDCVVWLDMNAVKKDRQYTFRVTTKAHPWGYPLDGGYYEAKTCRAAVKSANEKLGSSKVDWNILNFGPQGANVLPIPFCFFLKAQGQDKVKDVIRQCELMAKGQAQVWGEKYLEKVKNLDRREYEAIFEAITGLSDDKKEGYRIPAIVIDTKDDLDLLFGRIGLQGTRITNKELAYALMKSYWGEDNNDFGEVNKVRSEGIASEEDFAQLIFRLFASRSGIRDEIPPDYVRSLRLDTESNSEKSTIRNEILAAYHNNGELLSRLTARVDEWLLTCHTKGNTYHHIIRSDIASKKPSLYILLLRLALMERDGRLDSSITDEYIQAMAFYLYACLWDDSAIKRVYDCVMGCEGSITKETITNTLRDCISLGWAIPPVSTFSDFPGIQDSSIDAGWSLESFNKNKGYGLFERLFSYGNPWSSFVLELAESKYFKQQYKEYNPSRKDLWEGHNRPWDHDHIIPQKWIGENQPWSNFCSIWINSIGNIADIPFELNREKQDSDDWTYYERFYDKLLFYPENGRLSITEQLPENGFDEQRKEFFHFVRDRFLMIVEPFLLLINKLELYSTLSEIQITRKHFLLGAIKTFPDCTLHYYHNGIDKEIEDFEDNYAWQQPWLTLAKEIGDKERVVSLTMMYNKQGWFECQCGLRKKPDMYLEQMSNNDWWAHDGSFQRGRVWLTDNEGTVTTNNRYGWNPVQYFSELVNRFR